MNEASKPQKANAVLATLMVSALGLGAAVARTGSASKPVRGGSLTYLQSGTTDDIPLSDYTREIQISDVMTDYAPIIVNPNLRQIRVIIKYKVSGGWRTYTLTTFISSFS